jgi:hypothetical protein
MIDVSSVNDINEIDSLLAKLKASKKALKEAAKKQKLDVVAIANTLASVTQSVLDAQKAYEEKGFIVEIEIDEKTKLIRKWKLRNRRPKTQMVGGVIVKSAKIDQFTPDDLAKIMSKLSDEFSAKDIKKALIDSNLGERKLQPGLGKMVTGEYSGCGIEKVLGTDKGGTRYRKVK